MYMVKVVTFWFVVSIGLPFMVPVGIVESIVVVVLVNNLGKVVVPITFLVMITWSRMFQGVKNDSLRD